MPNKKAKQKKWDKAKRLKENKLRKRQQKRNQKVLRLKAEYAEKMSKKGFQFVTVGSDQRFMSSGAKESISKLKKTSSKEGKGY